MKNYCLKVAYDGTRFSGFQKQGNTENTIQRVLEDVFSDILGESIEVIASGRTDLGVHAIGQIINFKTNSEVSKDKILKFANKELSGDIVCKSIEEVDIRFHARYNAVKKKYLYKIDNGNFPNPFIRKYAYFYEGKVDIEKMRVAAKLFIGEQDFKAFSADKRKKKSTIRTIYDVQVNRNEDDINIVIEGNGFLYNMVRIISGTLLEVGIGKMEASNVTDIIKSQNRSESGIMLPPKGLYLLEVEYGN